VISYYSGTSQSIAPSQPSSASQSIEEGSVRDGQPFPILGE
jgi:hypothetical protein